MQVGVLFGPGDGNDYSNFVAGWMAELRHYAEVHVFPITASPYSTDHIERMNSLDLVHLHHHHADWGLEPPTRSRFWKFRYQIEAPFVVTAYDLRDFEALRRSYPPAGLAKLLSRPSPAWVESIEIAPFVTSRCLVHSKADRDCLVSRGANPTFVHVLPGGPPQTTDLEAVVEPTLKLYDLVLQDVVTLGHHHAHTSPSK